MLRAVPRFRVERNLQTAGVLWCAYGTYRVIGGLVGILFLRAFANGGFGGNGWPFRHGFGRGFGPGFGPPWLTAIVPVIAVVTIIGTVLAFCVGYGLLQRKPWGRMLAIVASILVLLKPILGTALGIYTLWLLAPSASAVEYDAIADHS